MARFAAALRLLEFAAAGTDRETAMREAIRRATRANGSVNVARLFAVAEWYVFRRVARERVDPPENSGA